MVAYHGNWVGTHSPVASETNFYVKKVIGFKRFLETGVLLKYLKLANYLTN
jgi:hypothetical protein